MAHASFDYSALHAPRHVRHECQLRAEHCIRRAATDSNITPADIFIIAITLRSHEAPRRIARHLARGRRIKSKKQLAAATAFFPTISRAHDFSLQLPSSHWPNAHTTHQTPHLSPATSSKRIISVAISADVGCGAQLHITHYYQDESTSYYIFADAQTFLRAFAVKRHIAKTHIIIIFFHALLAAGITAGDFQAVISASTL